jgi:hypothetical protein
MKNIVCFLLFCITITIMKAQMLKAGANFNNFSSDATQNLDPITSFILVRY